MNGQVGVTRGFHLFGLKVENGNIELDLEVKEIRMDHLDWLVVDILE